jgi:hypothetical protein
MKKIYSLIAVVFLSTVVCADVNDVFWNVSSGTWMTQSNWTENTTDGAKWAIPGWVVGNPYNTGASTDPNWNSGLAWIQSGTAQITPTSKPDGRILRLYVGGSSGAVLQISGDFSAYDTWIARYSGQSGTITQTAGNAYIINRAYWADNGSGTYNLSGGSLLMDCGTVYFGNNYGATLTLNQTGGNFWADGTLIAGSARGAVGTVNISSGIFEHTGTLVLGDSGVGTLNLTGGTANLKNVYIGRTGTVSKNSVCKITGGNFQASGAVLIGNSAMFKVSGSGASNISISQLGDSCSQARISVELDAGGVTPIKVTGAETDTYCGVRLFNSQLLVNTLSSYTGTVGSHYDIIWSASFMDFGDAGLTLINSSSHYFTYQILKGTDCGYESGYVLRLIESTPACGDALHPYPKYDFNQNCIVDWADFAIVAENWMFRYDADLTPSTGTFTVAVLPDTQNYVKTNVSQPASTNIFKSETQFIADNADNMNIAFVSHVGDVVSTRSNYAVEWTRADAAMRIILNAGIPLGMVPGNHDYDTWTANGTDWYIDGGEYWNNYFGNLTDYADGSGYGSAYVNSTDTSGMTSWQTFSAGGLDFLHIALEIEPSDAVLAWASSVIAMHPTYKVIVTTHKYLTGSGTYCGGAYREPYAYNTIEQLWSKFIKVHPQIFMVLCGHTGVSSRRISLNNAGKEVYQLMSDYQSMPSDTAGALGQGGGWFRLMEFNTATGMIHVRTYSSLLGKYSNDASLTDGSEYARFWAPFNYADSGAGDLLSEEDYRSSDFSFYSQAVLSPAK